MAKKGFVPESSAYINIHLEDTIIGMVAKEVSVNRQFPLETATLTALAVASHAVGMTYCCAYRDGQRLPIGLYALSEQPPGTAKTSVLNYFMSGIYDALMHINAERIKLLNMIKRSARDKKGEMTEQEEKDVENNQPITAPLTDITPEALDAVLGRQNGWFQAASTEQALVNVLVGGLYSDKPASNFDLVLKGFNGEWHSSSRIGRAGYSGFPHGGIVVISQDGVIDTILSRSDGTGLSERCLMLTEGNMFGYRSRQNSKRNSTAKLDFSNRITSIVKRLVNNESMALNDLRPLKFTDEAMDFIDEQMDQVEYMLKDGGEYSSNMFRGMWSKMDIQIMKVAATIHALSYPAGKEIDQMIDTESVALATCVVKVILMGIVDICENKGFLGKSVEREKLEEYVDKKPRTLRDIRGACRHWSCFKGVSKEDREERIAALLKEALNEGVFIETFQVGTIVKVFKKVG